MGFWIAAFDHNRDVNDELGTDAVAAKNPSQHCSIRHEKPS